MAKVTYLGEGEGGSDTNEWRGVKFKKGEAVTVTDEEILKRAVTNSHFKVDGYEPPKAAPPTETPPSQATMPAAVVKPGEPKK